MKAVYSLWTEPLSKDRGATWKKGNGGFATPFHYACSWGLSTELAKEHWGRVELVTDTEGVGFIKDLGVEFDKIDNKLDILNSFANMTTEYWMSGKFIAYQQSEPFVHSDNDVFFRLPIDPKTLNQRVFFQSLEKFSDKQYAFYRDSINILLDTATEYLPDEIKAMRGEKFEDMAACCTGILGGTDTEYITDYAQKALRIITDNPKFKTLPKKQGNDVVVSVEQWFLWCYLKYHNIPITPYLNDPYDAIETAIKGYTHLIAGSKGDPKNSEAVAEALERRFPKTYFKIQSSLD